MNTFISFLLVTIALTCCNAKARIEDKKIYKISNKADHGVLTVDTSSSGIDGDLVVKVADWTDGPGQKWKSKQPVLAKSFEFKPTSNEKAHLEADEMNSTVLSKLTSSGDTKYWYVRDMGEGVFQLKNYKTGSCATSQGNNKPVTLKSCDNQSQQQWVFKSL